MGVKYSRAIKGKSVVVKEKFNKVIAARQARRLPPGRLSGLKGKILGKVSAGADDYQGRSSCSPW